MKQLRNRQENYEITKLTDFEFDIIWVLYKLTVSAKLWVTVQGECEDRKSFAKKAYPY